MSPEIINILFIVAIFLVAYFFLLRPQSQKQKAQNTFLDSLSKGDRVVTSGGLHGKVTKVDEISLQMEISPKTFVTVNKSSISQELSAAHYPSENKAE